MSRVEGFLRFLWDFIIGDDWRIAAAAVVALGVTAVLAAWWILPLTVAGVLAVSVRSTGGT